MKLVWLVGLLPFIMLFVFLAQVPPALIPNLLFHSINADADLLILIVIIYKYLTNPNARSHGKFALCLFFLSFLLSWSYVARYLHDLKHLPDYVVLEGPITDIVLEMRSDDKLVRTIGAFALICGFSNLVATILVYESLNNSERDTRSESTFLRAMITSAGMLSVVVALVSAMGEVRQDVVRHVPAIGGILLSVSSASIGCYLSIVRGMHLRAVGIMFSFACGTLMGLVTFLVWSWPFVIILITEMPLAIALLIADPNSRVWKWIGISAKHPRA